MKACQKTVKKSTIVLKCHDNVKNAIKKETTTNKNSNNWKNEGIDDCVSNAKPEIAHQIRNLKQISHLTLIFQLQYRR